MAVIFLKVPENSRDLWENLYWLNNPCHLLGLTKLSQHSHEQTDFYLITFFPFQSWKHTRFRCFQGAASYLACADSANSLGGRPCFPCDWLTTAHLIKPASSKLQFMKESEAICQKNCWFYIAHVVLRAEPWMIMAGSLIKIVGVGVLQAVPRDSISLYEYRKIHQTEIIKWSRWGLQCRAEA